MAAGYLVRDAAGRSITEIGDLPWTEAAIPSGGGLVRTTLATYGAAINTAGGWTSGSFSPADGSLLVACVSGMHDSGATDPSADFTVTDSSGLTWTRRAYYGDASSWSIGGAIFTAQVTTGVSMTVSADCAARTMYSGSIVVLGFTGHDASSPIGATGTVSGPTNGAATITLSGTPASTSQVVGQLVIDLAGAPNTVVGADYTEIADLDMSGSAVEVMVRTASVASTSFGWDDVDGGGASLYKSAGMAVEIKVAASGSTVTGSGTSTAATTQSASGTATVFGQGSNTVTSSASASGTRTVVGAATSTATSSATSSGLRTVFGAAACTVTSSGSASGSVTSGAATVYGVATSTVSPSGTASGTVTVSGAAAATAAVTATASGLRSVFGAASSSVATTGSASGLRTVLGAIASAVTTTSSAIGVRIVYGVASAAAMVAGVASAIRTVFGAGTSTATSSGSATGVATVANQPGSVTLSVDCAAVGLTSAAATADLDAAVAACTITAASATAVVSAAAASVTITASEDS